MSIIITESEQRYRTLVDQIPAIVYIDNLASSPAQTQFVSSYIERMLGYTPEEWITGGFELWKDRTHPEDRERVLAEYERSSQSDGIFDSEYRLLSKDERIVWVKDYATRLHDEENNLSSYHGIIRDITAQVQSEAEIKQRVSELETLYENGLVISGLLKPQEIARRILQVLEKKLDWHHVAVRAYHPETDQVELLALNQPGISAAQNKKQVERLNRMIRTPDQGLSGWVIRHGEPVRCGDVSEDSRYIDTFPGLKSGLYVPIQIGDRIIGSIAVESQEENAFSDQDERLLLTLANQAAIAFENARLYLQLQEELEERARAENQVRKLNAELEQRVLLRTTEIETARHRLELAASAAGIGVWELKSRDTKVYWDERMHAVYGTSPTELQPTLANWIDFVYPEDRQTVEEKRAQAIEQGTPYENEFRIITAEGSIRHISSRAIVLFDDDQKFRDMIGVDMDITTIKQAEETLRMANAELERALRVKDEFLANMSHELRTPLNAILGLSESLEEQIAGPLNEKQGKYLHTISESGHHLLELINDILDLAKIEAGQIALDMNKVNVHLVCQASTRMVKQLAQRKEQELSVEIDERIVLIWADERRLKQMIVNLLSNAVKFTPQGGMLGIKVEAEHSSNTILITVWDSGIGISDKDLEHLFKPFVQLDSSLARESTGTGLGLVLVAQMARLHGGHIRVKSAPGAGSRFTIVLPWKPANQTGSLSLPQIDKPANQPDTLTGDKPTILIVEDTEAVVMMLKDYLESVGYQVAVARDGLDGIIQTGKLHPDLILMDVMMPGLDGLEATRRIRSEPAHADIPIIGLTALAMSSDRERCLAAGMNEYLSKPVKLNELQTIIQSYLSPKKEQES